MHTTVGADTGVNSPRVGRRWFLPAWTLVSVAIAGLLWWLGRVEWSEHVWSVQDAEGSWWNSVKRNLLIVHLSLNRSYPWLLLAPYAFAAGRHFSLERHRLARPLALQAASAAAFVALCQTFQHHINPTSPMRLVVTVTETAESEPANSSITRVLRRREEFRIQPASAPSEAAEHPASQQVPAKAAHHEGRHGVDRRHDPSVVEDAGPLEFQYTSRDPQGPVLPAALVWRSHIASAGLDFLVFVSLCGTGQAWEYRRRLRERDQRSAALEASLARTRLHALQAQLQPHFLFNTLNSITALVRQNPHAAEEMLTSLGDLLRQVLAGASEPLSTVREEMQFLRSYFDILQARFGERLQFQTSIDQAVLDFSLPRLLLQPLVENGIRHGLEKRTDRGPGRIFISGRREGDWIEFRVTDNGVGCPALVEGSGRWGVGLGNVRDRLRAHFADQFVFHFVTPPGGGLEACIRLPLEPPPARPHGAPSATLDPA